MLQADQGVIESASRVEAGEFVAVGERVGVFDDGTGEDECGDSEIDRAQPTGTARVQSEEDCP